MLLWESLIHGAVSSHSSVSCHLHCCCYLCQAKAASADADKVAEEVAQLKRLKGRLADMEAAAGRASLPLTPGGQVDFSQDFFGEKVFLTVSGQLNGAAAGLGVGCLPVCWVRHKHALGCADCAGHCFSRRRDACNSAGRHLHL